MKPRADPAWDSHGRSRVQPGSVRGAGQGKGDVSEEKDTEKASGVAGTLCPEADKGDDKGGAVDTERSPPRVIDKQGVSLGVKQNRCVSESRIRLVYKPRQMHPPPPGGKIQRICLQRTAQKRLASRTLLACLSYRCTEKMRHRKLN